MAITLHVKGTYRKTHNWLQKIVNKSDQSHILHKYGEKGCKRLRDATPVDSGKTARSWYYVVNHDERGYSLEWFNSNVNKGVPIALMIEYGHVTGWGGYVPPYPYIEEALDPIIEELTNMVWEDYTDGG